MEPSRFFIPVTFSFLNEKGQPRIYSCLTAKILPNPHHSKRIEATVGEQHDAAIRRDAPAIERGCDFLALDGWKGEDGKRIVCHGGRGTSVKPERAGVSNRTLHRFSALCHARHPPDSAVVNKTG